MPAEGAMTDHGGGVRLEGVTKRFGAVTALEGLSLRVAPGEVVAVVGTSGCGKSTLLELVCGLLEPDAGSVRSDPAVLMPQRDLLMAWMSALDNAALALRIAGASRDAAREQAQPLFERLRPGGVGGARRGGLRGRGAGGPWRRHAPARGVRAHAAVGPAGAVSRRAVRRARRAD